MNKIRQSLPWLQLLIAFVVFIAVLVVALKYQIELKEAVLVPLLYILWVGDLTLKSFDQQCIWLLALIIALLLSLAASRRTKHTVEDFQTPAHNRFLGSGRIHFWRGQIRLGSSTAYVHSHRRSELRRLVIKALAYREGVNIEEIKMQLRSGQLRVPPEVGYILGLEETQNELDQPEYFWKRIQQWFDQILKRFGTSTFVPDPRLEKTVEYLESLMEVDNDAGNR